MRSRQGPDRRNGWEFSKSKASWPNKRRALSQYCGFFFSRWSSAVVIGLLVVIVGIIQLKIGFHLDSNRAYTNIDGPKRYLAQFTNAQVTGKQPEFAYFLPKYNKISIKRSADFGGLEYTSLKNETKFYRKISFDDAWLYEQYRGRVVHSVDGNMKAYEHYDNDPPQDEPRDCRRPNWMDFQFPTCNALHELAFDRPRDDYLQPFKYNLVGEGTFRQVYHFYQPNDGEDFVLKSLIFKSRFDSYVQQMLYSIRYEALVMERLTASPRITDIYGFCGVTSILEPLPYEVNEMIQNGSGRANQTLLDRLDDVYPQNNLKPYEKVLIARDMAESLADMHGFVGGVLVHGDNHIDQFLANHDGIMKLGDFNLATILEWNEKKGEYCKREREPWRFRFRAPEEIGGTPFDEKIDVFTLGNAIYSLVTGLRPFYHDRRARVVCDEILNGTRGFIDPRYRERIFLETRLLEIMDQCWEHDGDERVDIFAVVKSLNKLLDDNDKLQVENGYKKQSAPFVVNVTERDELDSSSSSE